MEQVSLRSQLTPRRLAVAALPLLALVVVAATPQLLGRQVAHAWDGVAAASPLWLWVAVGAFLVSLLATVMSWRAAILATGTRPRHPDPPAPPRAPGPPLRPLAAAARSGVGCLVNTFAPASLGDAVRVGLLSQRVEGPDRLWTTRGAAASVAALRGVTMTVLIVAASVTGALPLWPVPLIC